MNRCARTSLILAAVAALLAPGAPLGAKEEESGRGVPQGGENGCRAIADVEASLGCRDLIIEIASAYLDSIETPGINYVPELPELLAPDAKRWINRSYAYQAPNNDGREAVLLGVTREPECTFPNKRWIVEGNLESGTASADFDAFCTGFPHAVIREWFRIEGGLIKEIEVRFVQVRCPTTAPWPCLP